MQSLRHWALLSVLAAVVTIGMKSTAYFLTGSAGLLSDALESGVNLIAACTAYFSLWYAHRPVDSNHTFGHEKIEFFAAGLEGILILVAGGGTIWYSIERLLHPQPIESLGLGTAIATAAAVVNLVTAQILLRVARQRKSIVLEADGKHLMTDVYTSLAVVAGLGLVLISGLQWLDPVLAMLVGANICRSGLELIWRSYDGLMDHALPVKDLEILREQIRKVLPAGTDFHALRTRMAGGRIFAQFHLLVPGLWSVKQAHDWTLQIEERLKAMQESMTVLIHIEPIEDHRSWEVTELEQIGEQSRPISLDGVSHDNG